MAGLTKRTLFFLGSINSDLFSGFSVDKRAFTQDCWLVIQVLKLTNRDSLPGPDLIEVDEVFHTTFIEQCSLELSSERPV